MEILEITFSEQGNMDPLPPAPRTPLPPPNPPTPHTHTLRGPHKLRQDGYQNIYLNHKYPVQTV